MSGDPRLVAVGQRRYLAMTNPEGGILNHPVMPRITFGRFRLATAGTGPPSLP